MIKAKIDMKNGLIDVECKGSSNDLVGEVFSLIGYIYSKALESKKPKFAENFRKDIKKIYHPLMEETVFDKNPWRNETLEIKANEDK